MRCISENWKDDPEQIKESTLLLEDEKIQSLFANYYYDYEIMTPVNSEYIHKDTVGPSSQLTADSANKK